MPKYLYTVDLDDTLLTRKKKIRKKTISVIKKITNKGNMFCICTGRPYSGAINFYKTLNLKMPMITDNGASIYFLDNDTKTFTIDLKIFQNFLTEVQDYIVSGITTIDKTIYIENREHVPNWIIHDEVPGIIIKEGILKDIIDKDVILPNLWVKKDNLKEFQDILDKYHETINFRNWGLHDEKYSYELFSVNASKGLAMNFLKEKFNLDYTVAFGDQWNDLSMIELADYGVAMKNAVDILKDKAKYQTDKDCDHNGVIHFIKKNKLF